MSCPSCGAALEPRAWGYDGWLPLVACPDGCGAWLDESALAALKPLLGALVPVRAVGAPRAPRGRMSARGVQLSRRIVGLAGYAIAPDALALLTRAQCEEHEVIPIAVAGSTVLVAIADAENLAALDDIRLSTGKNVEPVAAERDAILAAIDRSYPEETP